MLAVSPVRSSSNNGCCEGREAAEDFLLDDINFDDLFVGFDDGDMLPNLEIDPTDIFADFSFSSGEDSGNTVLVPDSSVGGDLEKPSTAEDFENKSGRSQGEVEVVSAPTKREKARSSKGSHGKKKAKVDWTPELHRRFVQAVEQLGVDKAVPSRILELMGIDCLTRHNIASHLQKYRSHRKHLLAREAEAASWSHRRQMYSGGSHGGGVKAAVNPNWATPPIIGYPPPMHQQPFRPLHVWGHPTGELPQLVPVWPCSPWAAPRPLHASMPPDLSYWHHPHYNRPLTHGTPCFPPPLIHAARFPAPPVPGIPPHPRFRPAPLTAAPPPPNKPPALPPIQFDAQPSNECVDAAIGDVLAKPWLPLPLGLKPPSLEGVMVELQKQGVAKIPPTYGSSL